MEMAPKKYLLFKLCQNESCHYRWVAWGEGDTKAECATLAYDMENVYIWRAFKEDDAQDFLCLLQECMEVAYKIEPSDFNS